MLGSLMLDMMVLIGVFGNFFSVLVLFFVVVIVVFVSFSSVVSDSVVF